ncbi:hypothetical protein EI94DRAFT_1701298 [Lactarius quietus]|nr:hypothetical protein EI94DRAFT_1701298 [Lactarius quietus]
MGNSSPQPVPPEPVNTQDDESVAWFFALDQDNSGQISAEELRCALMNEDGGRSMSLTSFSCNVLLIPRVGAAFSFETVQYLMSVFDLDGSGEIGLEEKWREMFESFDYNQDGIIDAAELESALNHYQLQVGRPVINFLVHKYVQQMCALYGRCEDGRTQPMEVSRDEFLLSILRLP